MASLQPKTRVFTGIITKMHDNFGFIDDDVFFQLGSCDDKSPSLGDRVMVEAQFNPNMPFKWHASQVKLVGRQQKPAVSSLGGAARYNPRPQFPPQGLKFVPTGHGAGLLGAAPASVLNQHLPQHRHQHMQAGKARKRNAQNQPRPAARQHRPTPPVRKSKEGDIKKRRTRSPPSHRRSPGHHATTENNTRRPTPRYMVRYYKRALTRKTSDALSLKHLYHNLYIPSDFFFADYNWQESFTLNQQLSVGKSQFHIFNKEVNSLVRMEDNILNPTDADHTWVAKVMLLQAPSKDETYQQCCKLAEDSSQTFLHQTRVYKFLVGTKNKKEVMAIGGSWSPSLDGPDPGTNPLTLVNTAIRTCKALVGLNLSKCTQWRRVLHIQYHRGAEIHKGRSVPDRVENTVIFLPDIHSCMPNATEYKSLRTSYAAECESHIKFEREAVLAESKIAEIPDFEVNHLEEQDNAAASVSADNHDEIADKKQEEAETKAENGNSEEAVATPSKANASLDESMEVENNKDGDGLTPTHYSKLDIKTLKVQPLRKELEARGLSPRGLKLALVQRLTEALEDEARKDAVQAEEKEPMEKKIGNAGGEEKDVKMQEIEKTESAADKKEKLDEDEDKDQTKLIKSENEDKSGDKKKSETEELKKPREVDEDGIRRHYVLPETHPVITVHPNQEYKKGNFDCTVTSLSNLLAYRQVDNKESIFEVSVFAEAFNEMLQRGHAFNIYKALSNPLPRLKSEKEEAGKEDKSDGEDNKVVNEDEPKAKKSKSENEEKDSEGKHDKSEDEKTEEAHKEAPDEKTNVVCSQSQEGKDDEKASSNDKTDKSEKRDCKNSSEKPEKMVTLRKDLLLSFVYFDTTQCGYLKSNDMRDILHSIGIGLSRNQITTLISKHVEHDNLKYRKLTDVPETQLETYKELLKDAEKPDLDSLIAGNASLTSKIAVCNGNLKKSKPSVSVSDGIIMFNGAVVDVRSLQDTLANSEDIRSDLETQLVKLKNDLDSANKQLAGIETEKKSLEWDFISTKKKLTETEVNLKSTMESKNKFEKTLKNIAKNVENALPKTSE